MEVAPRLKSVEKRTEPAASTTKVRFVRPEEKEAPKEAPVKPEEPVEEPVEEPEKKGFFGSTIVLVIIFATIIVVLILVVVWLVSRNDSKYLSWMRGGSPAPTPPAQPQPQPPAKRPSTHTDLVNDAGTDELALYAALGEKKDEPEQPKREKMTEKAEPKKEKEETKEKEESAKLEEDLDAQLDALAAATDDEVVPSAISDVIDAEVAQMDAVQHRPIEQVSPKTGAVVKLFPTNESITKEKYDIASVLQCCRGEKAKHKSYIWRFQEEVVAPPE
jgi:hypothetical protein